MSELDELRKENRRLRACIHSMARGLRGLERLPLSVDAHDGQPLHTREHLASYAKLFRGGIDEVTCETVGKAVVEVFPCRHTLDTLRPDSCAMCRMIDALIDLEAWFILGEIDRRERAARSKELRKTWPRNLEGPWLGRKPGQRADAIADAAVVSSSMRP